MLTYLTKIYYDIYMLLPYITKIYSLICGDKTRYNCKVDEN
jgi:hypothetical protein